MIYILYIYISDINTYIHLYIHIYQGLNYLLRSNPRKVSEYF